MAATPSGDINRTIVRNTAFGRGLYVDRDLAPGDVILSINDPLLVIPTVDAMRDVCYTCMKTNEDLKHCVQCKAVWYCSKDCQLKSWRDVHKYECGQLGKLTEDGKVLPTATRALVHMLIRYEWSRNESNQATWDSVLRLVSHMDNIRRQSNLANKDMWNDTQLHAHMAMKIAQCGVLPLAIQFYCIMASNGFQTRDQGDTKARGFVLDPVAAMANHSCDPNAVARSAARRFTIKSLRPIRQGEQIFLSYVDVEDNVIDRRVRLAEVYWFDCHCPRCDFELAELEARRAAEEARERAILGQQEVLIAEMMSTIAPLNVGYEHRHPSAPPLYSASQLRNKLLKISRPRAEEAVLGGSIERSERYMSAMIDLTNLLESYTK